MQSPQQIDYANAKKNVEEAQKRLAELRKFHGVRSLWEEMSDKELEFHTKMEMRCLQDSKLHEALLDLGGCEQELIHWAKGMVNNTTGVPDKLRQNLMESFGLIRFRSLRKEVISMCEKFNIHLEDK